MPKTGDTALTGAPSGTQSIDRAVELLQLIAHQGMVGARLSTLSEQAGLSPPTARRILKRLVELKLVDQNADSKRYTLGSLTFELGMAASAHMPAIAVFRPMLERISHACGDTLYLIMRRGMESVILDCIEGNSPVKAITHRVGQRSPLGIGAASSVLLSVLPDEDVHRIIEENDQLYRNVNAPHGEALWQEVLRIRKQGYALRPNVMSDAVMALGMAVPNKYGLPYAAISISLIKSDLTPERCQGLVAMVRREFDRFAQVQKL